MINSTSILWNYAAKFAELLDEDLEPRDEPRHEKAIKGFLDRLFK